MLTKQSGRAGAVSCLPCRADDHATWYTECAAAPHTDSCAPACVPPQEAIDGDLSSRVFMLLSCCDEGFHARRYEEPSRQRLDSAIINFFQGFRRVYIGEQVGLGQGDTRLLLRHIKLCI
jgi:hypothetical protein